MDEVVRKEHGAHLFVFTPKYSFIQFANFRFVHRLTVGILSCSTGTGVIKQ